MLTAAYELVMLESGKNYKYQNGGPIFRIQALKDNESQVTIEAYGGEAIIFPPRSFIAGAVYDILIQTIQFDTEKCGFVGYKFKNKPYNLDI